MADPSGKPSRARKDRGMRTQLVVAEYLAANGWPAAYSTGSGRKGVDIGGAPDLAVEVKARAGFQPLAWTKQANSNSDDGKMPFAVMRCNGQGEHPEEYVALIQFGRLVRLLREAGYGAG